MGLGETLLRFGEREEALRLFNEVASMGFDDDIELMLTIGRALYRAETDPEKVVPAIVRSRKRREWDPILENVRDWRARLGKERSAEARSLEERMALIEGLVATVDSMADSFLKGGVLSKIGLKALVTSARRKGKSKR